eukprot:CAMPEP_0183413718 /NCGR_PEP_ID=MMETSP0370-20130417/21890_1 /TAXON_ID=268820 /ORGANISM="Peridinium aciculiferum, Strain PAER-2" /LENGTH=1097 /DNA_ID=CAMNT_0025596963 /DNA_START=30 /DNA_END=3319 /DNA_ORIENTATION=-
MEPPPEKKQKTEEAEAEEPKTADAEMKSAEGETAEDAKMEEPPKAPEPPKELEEDEKPCSKPKIKDPVAFLTPDTTLNVLPSVNSSILMCMKDGGIQHFHAGARASVGVSKGRYFFEAKVVEFLHSGDAAAQGTHRKPRPDNFLRIGVSTAGSTLVLGATEDNVCFDTDGSVVHNKTRLPGGTKIYREAVMGVLVNLDKDSPNYQTLSLFKDGKRASQPQPLPDCLKGKTLYPHVSYKNATVHVNFGSTPMAPLPFTCRMVQDATKADVEVSTHKAPDDGKYDVVFPVSLPDEGSFDWLDLFMEKNPTYTELSDRMVLDWAEKSGLWRPKGSNSCNDKPDMHFQVPELDDSSVRRAVYSIAPLQARNYVVMEVKSNLIEDERKEILNRFSTGTFKKTALVTMGEPTADFKKRTTELVLKQKQEASDKTFELQQLEAQRKKQMEKKVKEMENMRKALEKAKKKAEKQAEKEANKKAAEEKKAAEAAAKAAAKAAAEPAAEGEEKMEEEEKEEKEEEKEEEEEEEVDEKEEEAAEEAVELEEPKPKVELTAEDKKIVFRTRDIKDLAPFVMSTTFAKFSVPKKAEGFDEVKFEWSKEAKCEEYLKTWILDKKLNTRIEDLAPSVWFQQKWKEWLSTVQSWHGELGKYDNRIAKKKAEKLSKQARKLADKARKEAEKVRKEALKKAAAEKAEADKAAAEKAAEEAKEGGEAKEGEEEAKPMEVDEKKEEEKKEEEEEEEVEEKEEAEEEDEEAKLDFDNLDVFGVDNVVDVGAQVPLFKAFRFEDWAMMSLRFELHLLAHAFRKDVEDPDRQGIQTDHLPFYYNRYFKKNLNVKDYGVETAAELIDLVNDCVYLAPKSVLDNRLTEDMESFAVFAKLTEEARRYRALRIDLGEDAALKINMAAWQQQQGGPRGKKWGKGEQKGGLPHLGGLAKGGKGDQKGSLPYLGGLAKGLPKGALPAGGHSKGGFQAPVSVGVQSGNWGKAQQQQAPMQQKGGMQVVPPPPPSAAGVQQQKGAAPQHFQQQVKGAPQHFEQKGYGKAQDKGKAAGKGGGSYGGYSQPYGGKSGGKDSGKGGKDFGKGGQKGSYGGGGGGGGSWQKGG